DESLWSAARGEPRHTDGRRVTLPATRDRADGCAACSHRPVGDDAEPDAAPCVLQLQRVLTAPRPDANCLHRPPELNRDLRARRPPRAAPPSAGGPAPAPRVSAPCRGGAGPPRRPSPTGPVAEPSARS